MWKLERRFWASLFLWYSFGATPYERVPMSNRMKHISRIAACACAVCALCMLLVSCSGGDVEKKTPAQLNREYMASVNRAFNLTNEELEMRNRQKACLYFDEGDNQVKCSTKNILFP